MISKEPLDPKLFDSMKLPSLFIIKTPMQEELGNLQDPMQDENVGPLLKNYEECRDGHSGALGQV